MKNIKKVLALVLAVVLTLSLAANVFAANSNGTSKETGSITIANPQTTSTGTAVTYTAYKIFDLTYTETNTDGTGGDNPYAYFLAKGSEWENEFVKIETGEDGDTITYLYTGDGLVLTPVYDTDEAIVGYNVSVTEEFRPADFAAYVQGKLTGKSGTAFNSEDGKTVTGLPFGYYLVNPSSGALASLTSTDPDVTINDKNEKPEVEKVILEEKAEEEAEEEDEEAAPEYDELKVNEASIGEAVEYKLTTEIPDMTGYDYYFFVVNDVLSKGLTFNDDVLVYLGEDELTVDEDYSVKTVDLVDEDGKPTGETELRIVFKDMVKNYYSSNPEENMVGTPIVITYSATVNQDALIGDANENTAKIEYSNDPTIVPEWDSTPDPEDPENPPTDQDDPRDPGYDWNDDEDDENEPPVGEGPESETKTYVSEVELTKVADDGTTTLTGAKFSISGVNQKAVIVNETIFREYDEDTDEEVTEFYYRLKDGTYTTVEPTTDTATVRYDEKALEGDAWTRYDEAVDGKHVGYYFDVEGVKTLITDDNIDSINEDATVYQLIYTNAGLYFKTAGAEGAEDTYTLIDETNAAEHATDETLYQKVNVKGWDSFEDNTKYVKVETVNKDSTCESFEAEGWVDENGKLTFQGLGAGTYYITELVAPDGYNILTAPLELVIDFAATETEGVVTGGAFTAKLNSKDATVTNGVISFNVVNKQGTELPETGGIGTTIFYVIGSILLAGAAVLLITKKRMSAKA